MHAQSTKHTRISCIQAREQFVAPRHVQPRALPGDLRRQVTSRTCTAHRAKYSKHTSTRHMHAHTSTHARARFFLSHIFIFAILISRLVCKPPPHADLSAFFPISPETLQSVIFFKENPAAAALFTALKITTLTEIDILRAHFLPTLPLRHPNEQFMILQWAVMSMQLSEAELTKLTQCKFMLVLNMQKSFFMAHLPPTIYTRVCILCQICSFFFFFLLHAFY